LKRFSIPSIAWEPPHYMNRQCYLTFILWPEIWLYIYTQNFETRCLKSDTRKYFPSLCNYSIAQRCRPFARHDWHVCIISHWLRTRETSKLLRSIWCCPNDLSKSSPVLFFGELGACLKTWLDQRILDSKTSSPIKRSISDDMWNRGSVKQMLRGKWNLSRPEEIAGILSVTWSITMHSIAAYELSRDCNLILIVIGRGYHAIDAGNRDI